jgi:hypothetical protein
MTFTGSSAPFGRGPERSIKGGPSAASFTDGLGNTILFLEAGTDRGVPWTKPEDVPLDVSNPLPALGDLSSGAIRVAMADSKLAKLGADISPARLAALATSTGAGGATMPPSEELLGAATLIGRELARSGRADPPTLSNNFKQIVLAMLDYESARARFPASSFSAAGDPLLSWRVLILPYLGLGNLYSKFHLNEPWDSPHNLSLLEYMPDVYRGVGDAWNSMTTRAMTFVGTGAPFTGTTSQGPTYASIQDGSSNTFSVVETGVGNAAPWSKPVDAPFHKNNPFSALGDLGPHLVSAFFDGSVRPQLSSMSIDQLYAFTTHNGGDNTTPPPAVPNVPGLFIHQTGGDTETNEFGVDSFDLVLDKAPLSNVVLGISLSNAAVATLDKTTVTFTPQNWNMPQRVAFRAMDDRSVNADRIVDVTVSVVDNLSDNSYDPLANQTFTALVRNDVAPQPPDADFNGDARIDGADFLQWQRGLGTSGGVLKSQGDANGDGIVSSADLATWRAQFAAGAPAEPADFNSDGRVNDADLGLWKTGFGTPTGAQSSHGDADLDGDVDGADFLAWQRALNVVGQASASAVSVGEFSQASGLQAADPQPPPPNWDLLAGASMPFTHSFTTSPGTPAVSLEVLVGEHATIRDEALASLPVVSTHGVFVADPLAVRQEEGVAVETSLSDVDAIWSGFAPERIGVRIH